MNPAYWEERYASGGDSGAGSQGELVIEKARQVNAVIEAHGVRTMIDWGCGDGALLSLLNLEHVEYFGVDVAPTAVRRCMEVAPSQQFMLYRPTSSILPYVVAQLALSISVIYHLVDDDEYYEYMSRLFGSASEFVMVWASDRDEQTAPHVRHRAWTQTTKNVWPNWHLLQQPLEHAGEGFYLFTRA